MVYSGSLSKTPYHFLYLESIQNHETNLNEGFQKVFCQAASFWAPDQHSKKNIQQKTKITALCNPLPNFIGTPFFNSTYWSVLLGFYEVFSEFLVGFTVFCGILGWLFNSTSPHNKQIDDICVQYIDHATLSYIL